MSRRTCKKCYLKIQYRIQRKGSREHPGYVAAAERQRSKRMFLEQWRLQSMSENPYPAVSLVTTTSGLSGGGSICLLSTIISYHRLHRLASKWHLEYGSSRLLGATSYCLPLNPVVESESTRRLFSVELSFSRALLSFPPKTGPNPPRTTLSRRPVSRATK